MIRGIHLTPISEIIAQVKAEAKESAKHAIERGKNRIKKIEQTRLAALLLDGAGVELSIPSWNTGDYLEVDLGEQGTTKKAKAAWLRKLQQVRHALGCRLMPEGQDLADAKKRLVTVLLKPADFPTVTIKYVTRLPKNSLCRIEKQRSRSSAHTYYSLVCER